jgi:integrase
VERWRGQDRVRVTKIVIDNEQEPQGGCLIHGHAPLAEFIRYWLNDIIKPACKSSTYASYDERSRLCLLPALGHIPLNKLTATQIQQLVTQLRDLNLSARTIQYTIAVLSRALNYAVAIDVIGRNPCRAVRTPRVIKHKVKPLTIEQANALLAAADNHQLGLLFRLALSLGLRRGELLALTWDNIDLERGVLTVQEAKTQAGNRTIPLPQVLIEKLRQHYAIQHTPQNLVFTTRNGTPIQARNLVRTYKSLLRQAGIPDRRFHDLRHSCATFLIAQGVNLHAVKYILGHSTIRVTSDIYGHMFTNTTRDILDNVAGLFS